MLLAPDNISKGQYFYLTDESGKEQSLHTYEMLKEDTLIMSTASI